MSPTGWVLAGVACAVGLAVAAGGLTAEYASGPRHVAAGQDPYPTLRGAQTYAENTTTNYYIERMAERIAAQDEYVASLDECGAATPLGPCR